MDLITMEGLNSERLFVMLVLGQRGVRVIPARCEWSTIVAKVKLSFGLR
jgi:hypothetical protein